MHKNLYIVISEFSIFNDVDSLGTIALNFANTIICYFSMLINYASKHDTKIEIYVRNEKRREGALLEKEIYDVEVAKLTYIIYVQTIDINFLVVTSSFNGKSLTLLVPWYTM